jgi:hypothetical protein
MVGGKMVPAYMYVNWMLQCQPLPSLSQLLDSLLNQQVSLLRGETSVRSYRRWDFEAELAGAIIGSTTVVRRLLEVQCCWGW